jgi:hypothetical protein
VKPDVASSSLRDTDLIIRRTSYPWLALDLCKLLGIYLSFMLLAVIVLGLFWEAMKYTLWGMRIDGGLSPFGGTRPFPFTRWQQRAAVYLVRNRRIRLTQRGLLADERYRFRPTCRGR